MIKGNLIGMGISYTITNLGTQQNPVTKNLYDCETLKTKNNNISFSKCNIPVMFLNTNGNAEENNVLIEIRDIKHKTILGNFKEQLQDY